MLSIMLELFGHVLIQVALILSYKIDFQDKRMICLTINMAQWTDVGGFAFGNLFGKDPFVHSISPSKTVQGIQGAFFTPVLIATIWYSIGQWSDGYYMVKMPWIDFAFLGISCAFMSIIGDLNESFIKRCSNIKDSGSIIPGHGGILDRVDSLLLTMPFMFWYTTEYTKFCQSSAYSPEAIHIM